MAIHLIRLLALTLAVLALWSSRAPDASARSVFGSRALLHAHNCYPDEGQWADRLERALATGLSRIAIEQDLAWAPGSRGDAGRIVVSHDTELSGTEPTLEQHFFARVRPIMEKAIAGNQRDRWPLLILHLDFKSNEPEHHHAVWDVLERHQQWLTTAERVADSARVMPFAVGPLLVLTENGPGQEAIFSDAVKAGDRLLIFGTTPAADLPRTEDPDLRSRMLASAAPPILMPSPATNYRRWTNFPWQVVEQGGPPRAGAWTAADAGRLHAIVNFAHERGLWLRFYTLNGHTDAENRGWTAGYNFGSLSAVRQRWKAAIEAGVDFIATDQYEEMAKLLVPENRSQPAFRQPPADRRQNLSLN